jgi:hypothetical protein
MNEPFNSPNFVFEQNSQSSSTSNQETQMDDSTTTQNQGSSAYSQPHASTQQQRDAIRTWEDLHGKDVTLKTEKLVSDAMTIFEAKRKKDVSLQTNQLKAQEEFSKIVRELHIKRQAEATVRAEEKARLTSGWSFAGRVLDGAVTFAVFAAANMTFAYIATRNEKNANGTFKAGFRASPRPMGARAAS